MLSKLFPPRPGPKASGRTIYRAFHPWTMVSPPMYADNIDLARQVRDIPGDVVECGVWRGGMVAGIASVLKGQGRTYHLFDSFEGLPEAKDIDGDAAKQWQAAKTDAYYFDNCKAEQAYAEEAMAKAGEPSYRIHKGWFNQTVPGVRIEPGIALLRLDGDWYESTWVCLEAFYPQVVKGGMIVIDDYFIWDGCSRAVHDYLSKTRSTDRIRHTPEGVAYLIKGAPNTYEKYLAEKASKPSA
jgi:O-methyltransferase